MTIQDFQDAFTLLLSGVIEKDGSVKWEDDVFGEVFITFPTFTPNEVTVVKYYKNGNKYWEEEWVKGKRHGKSLGWYENGNKEWEAEWVKGKQHGKSLGWYENRNKWWERNWIKNKLHGKEKRWYCGRDEPYYEADWINGRNIKKRQE